MSVLNKVRNILPTKRKIIQLYFALLYNANLKGFTSGSIYKGDTKNFCVPGLNCYSCPGAVGACPLGSLQGALGSGKSTLYYMCGILVLFGILFGRLICGYACPFGLVQELVYKIKTPKLKKSFVTRILSYLKYVILVVFVFIIPIIYALRDVPLPAFCKYICPAGTLEGGVSLLANKVNESYFSMLGPIFTWKFALLVSFMVGCVFVFRLFCRFFCPLGALYGFFNRFSLFGIKLNEDKCIHCDKCINHCKMDIKHVGDHECIGCGDCVSVCPTNAISWKGSVFTLPANEIGNTPEPKKKSTKKLVIRIATTVVAIGILAGAVAYYWMDEPTPPQVITPSEDSPYSAELNVFTSAGLTGTTVDPTKNGKVTVVNFWGTWCTPCVAELPHFDSVASEYGDSVAVIAVHTDGLFDTAAAFVGQYYSDSKIIFAKDSMGEGYYSLLGGRDAYPYTVIFNAKGEITDKFVGSVTHEALKAAVDKALK